MFWFGASLSVCIVTSVVGWFTVYVLAHSMAQKFFLGKPSKIRFFIYPLYFMVMAGTAAAAGLFVYGMYLTFSGLKAHV